MKRLARIGCAVFAVIAFAGPAAAQSVGVRAGASVDPDQFFFGGHVETAPLVSEVRFRPNVEIGVGNNVTVVAFNLEFAYFFAPVGGGWRPYAGAGPALNIIDTENATNSEGGFNFLGGIAHSSGLFGEIKVGVLDSPDFKATIGYSFRWR